ncbi:hypothetical protein SLOPH_693 [Spraguea lophii 42_110]|uniref:Uncharacterized protein n=1 Tax=Spraguea lophii (strain 42_110) TaxID=1358809 RepID=S7WD04_SPRLO|nr:hypothetical protein SLOPH_693 [Spraguea lophii 42_110]
MLFLFFSLFLSKSFYFKLSDEERYFAVVNNVQVSTIKDKGDALVLNLDYSTIPGGYFIVAKNKENKIFNIRNEQENLTISKRKSSKGGRVFVIAIIPKENVLIRSQGKCLEYFPERKSFRMEECEDRNPMQRFKMEYLKKSVNVPDEEVERIMDPPRDESPYLGSRNGNLQDFMRFRDNMLGNSYSQKSYRYNSYQGH